MASADNFAIEERNAAKAIEWMNSYASKNHKKFETKLEGYILSTTNFGNFEVISWNGDWSTARSIIIRVSKKLNLRVIESGYHQKGDFLRSLFLVSKEFAKVYSDGRLIGNIVLSMASGKWTVESETLR
ncbi:MAG: hypothetical protein ACRD8Z_23870 [Nitrososphaeraceae archaeon]